MSRSLFAGFILLFAAQALSAQITTYIAPPRPPGANSVAVTAADSIRRDSVQRAAIANMKAWVDSAAGVSVPRSVADSTTVANDSSRTVVTSFSNGTVAPATASDLPALAILGLIGLAVGAGLLANRPRG